MEFGTYPYTTTRVKAGRALLLTKDDYIKMKKMGINEMIRFLEEREYKKEIDSLSSEYRGMELINVALNENLANTVNKLYMISTKESRVLIKNYSLKWIINNLKIILRSKGQDLVRKSIVPISPTTYSHCLEMIKKDKDEFIREIIKITGVDELRFKKHYNENDIISMENELDMSYHVKLLAVHKALGNGMLKKFYKFLVELVDIRNIIKLKSIDIDQKTIESLVVSKTVLVGDLLNQNLDECIKTLKESKYKEFVVDVDKDLSRLENNIEKYLLRYSFRLLHLRPLSIAPIFGYLLAKEIEIRNLKLLINAKALGMDDKFIEDNLILE